MILYIVSDNDKNAVVTDLEINNIKSVNVYLNDLAIINLTSINGYKSSVKKVLKICSGIPLYFNKDILLFRLKTYNENDYFINYFSLLGICYNEEEVLFVFRNYKYLKISSSIRSLKTQLKKCEQIDNYLKTFDK